MNLKKANKVNAKDKAPEGQTTVKTNGSDNA